MYTGSLDAYQGVDDIVTAAAFTSGVRYVLFGSPSGDLRQRVVGAGLADTITWWNCPQAVADDMPNFWPSPT